LPLWSGSLSADGTSVCLDSFQVESDPDEEKEKVYDQINERYLKAKPITVREHKSGFPAVTVDTEGIHIITDCISLEQ